METDKFEKHIKKKLQEREITPSANAWNTISRELNTVSAPKKKNYVWVGIAASILVLFGLAWYNFNDAANQLSSPVKVVETTKDEKPKEKLENTISPIKKHQKAVVVEAEIKSSQNLKAAKNASTPVNTVPAKVIANNKPVLAVVKAQPVKNPLENLQVTEAVLNDKIAAIVNRVSVLEQSGSLTDAEVDSLLQQAQQELVRDKILNAEKSVDAMALLTDVEDELDQSFRDKIFERLKNGFAKVRSGVAENNN